MASAALYLLHQLLLFLVSSVALIVVLGIVFIPLAELFPSKASQPLLRRDMIIDLLYYFCLPAVYLPVSMIFAGMFQKILYPHGGGAEGLFPALAHLPLWEQFLIIVVAIDFLQYWVHRLFHKRALWKWHSIHHSSENVDWLSSTRWHPVNYVFFVTLIKDGIQVLGFSPGAFVWVTLSYTVNACLVHANLNWTYGPLRYVFASPVFHRWHHTSAAEGGEKNFAPYFSVFDLMFGTFYMPKGQVPTKFGAPYDKVPDNFLGQLAYPFMPEKRRRKRLTNGSPLSRG